MNNLPQALQTRQRDSLLIKVSGTGEIVLQPDLAIINIGVMTQNKELLQAQQQNSRSINKVIQSLLGNGIHDHLIKTFDYRIDSEYDFDQGKQIFRGYKVSHLLQVTIEDLPSIGRVVDGAVKQGANYVANVQFTVKNSEVYYQQALSVAVGNSIQKAKSIANTLNVMLDPVPVRIIEGMRLERPYSNQQVSLVKGISSSLFEPGQLTVKSEIRADFQYMK